MIVRHLGDAALGVIEHTNMLDAEGSHALGMGHEHGLQWMIEIGIEGQMEFTDRLRLRPVETECGELIALCRNPHVRR